MDFIAIDFETANPRSDSACQIGIAVVWNNKIIESRSWLIKPPYGGFYPFYTSIHGITLDDVENEPLFDKLWETVKPYFDNTNLLIAHNASFDINVLFNTLKLFEIAVPDLTIACTVAMARRAWAGEQSYSLKAMAKKFDIKFLHHDAGEDARACAEIAIRVFEHYKLENITLNAGTIDEVGRTIGIYFGYMDEHKYVNCHCRPKQKKAYHGQS
ncbi:MAG: hypothetical protein LBL90_03860 [Prevotellaceae bacterium]|jgi:DNA polymerase-3 subunit epsilon|nr:hypothetical protein [Prevotellaceae bacterium]